MCRISGILNYQLPVASLGHIVKEMCTIMKHGGPDDEGIYTDESHPLVLGHRRLSLIDLSASGHQPMTYAEKRYVITFNGEIYNYLTIKAELLKEGFSFNTGSDTEVILAAFAAWGTESFEKLNGMFAFALWDRQEAKIYLVRDPSGIKPLYYAITDEGLAFSSEIRGFKPVPWLQEENKQWPVFLMAYGHLPEPVTVLQKVQPLQKGSFLRFDSLTTAYEIKTFKQFHFTDKIVQRNNAIHLIKEGLHDSVSRHLIADAPIGVFLSGGVDSGIVALLASADKKTQLNTLSLHFEDNDFSEKKYQDLLLETLHCGSNQHLLKEEEFHENLPGILDAMDQPSCDGINTWFISKYAKESGLKAVLSGIGGDELYGGYPSFERMQKVNLLKNMPNSFLKAGKHTGLKTLKRLGYLTIGGATGEYLFLRGQFIPSEIAHHLNMDEKEVWNILSERPLYESRAPLPSFDEASWIELNMFMQNQLLRDVDVMGMAHGIEIRVPFLDKEFVDLSLNINDRLKEEGPLPKQLLIDSFKDILPEPIWNRPKMGFGFPFKQWLANDDFVKSLIEPGDTNYKSFTSGSMHWSQFLSLLLIKYRGVSPSAPNTAGIKDHKNGIKPVKIIEQQLSPKMASANAAVKKVLLLTLRTFSLTGGIEKVSKVAGKAIFENGEENGYALRVFSMYDKPQQVDSRYIPSKVFTGFGTRKVRFVLKSFFEGIKSDVIVLSHLNLLTIGYFIKIFSPGSRIVLIAHGIEAWEDLPYYKKKMLRRFDKIIAVSNFTKNTMVRLNGLSVNKIRVINNCLDPFLQSPPQDGKNERLRRKYGFEQQDIILLTLGRMMSAEGYKGYDMVLEAIHSLRDKHPFLKYLLVGKYDIAEKERIDALIESFGLMYRVVFAGFVPEEELADHFNLADIYIMPSEKEGFGIVFIEAMYYHKPVIAGNKDGSTDALLNGKLGLLVNPSSKEEVSEAIGSIICNKDQYLPDNHLLMEHFSFPVYKENWREVLEEL